VAGGVGTPAARGGGHRGCLFRRGAARGSGEASWRAVCRAEEGGGSLGGLAADLEFGARRGCPRVPADGSVAAGRTGVRRGQGPGAPFKVTCRPLSDQQTGGGCLGNARAQRAADRPLVRRVYTRRLGTRDVPCVRGLGRRVATLGRRVRPREHAPAGPDAEAAAARGARRAGWRDVAARPGSGAALFGLRHFEHIFLPKLEYKCIK
jgi:hypothetical protein